MQIIELQQGSEEWLEARLGKISGTRLGQATGSPAIQETLINELIAELLTAEKKDNYVNLAMAKGTEAEAHAIEEYEEKTGEITEEIGLCISDDYEWLVNSPDRLIKKKGKFSKAVEVKSPNPETAIKYIRNGGIPKEYEGQIISYFLVNNDLEELDFVVYSPTIQTEQYRLWIKNIKRKDLDLEKAKEKVLLFWQRYEEALKQLNLAL